MSLRDWEEYCARFRASRHLEDYLAKEHPASRRAGGPTNEQWRQRLESGRLVLLLDGLDELEHGGRFARELESLLPRWHESFPVILTCRSLSVDAYRSALTGWPIFSPAGLSTEQRRHFIELYPRNKGRLQTNVLERQLAEHLEMLPLAENPLLLNVICFLVDEGLQLPATRADLYDQAVDQLLDRDKLVDFDKISFGDRTTARRILARVAASLFIGNEGLHPASAKEYDDALDEALPQNEFTTDRHLWKCDLKAWFKERSGLVRESRAGVTFLHNQFLEFLAGEGLAADPLFGEHVAAGIRNVDAWREVIKYAAERKLARSADLQSISISGNRRGTQRFWTAVAERSGDTALERPAGATKAAWRFASRRTPKCSVAAGPRCAVSPISNRQGTDLSERPELAGPGAGYKPAIRQTGSLRYEAPDGAGQVRALLDALVGAGDPATDLGWRKAVLAGEIIRDLGLERMGLSTEEGKPCFTRVRERLVALIEKESPLPRNEQHKGLTIHERAHAGEVLGWIGDTRPGVGTFVVPASADGLAADRLNAGLPTRLPDIVFVPEPPEPPLPAGIFVLAENKQRVVIKQPYRIGRYPVTVEQFQTFVDAGGYDETSPEASRWWSAEGWRWKLKDSITGPRDHDAVFQTPNHPRVGVSWYEADAFCRWLTEQLRKAGALKPDGLIRLAHEVEWEQAARWNKKLGQTDARRFPWVDARDDEDEKVLPQRCNWDQTGLGHTSVVGLFPSGDAECGAADLSGNVWEWCENLQADGQPWWVLLGGSWLGVRPEHLSGSYRNDYGPGGRLGLVGFRCVVAGVGSAPRWRHRTFGAMPDGNHSCPARAKRSPNRPPHAPRKRGKDAAVAVAGKHSPKVTAVKFPARGVHAASSDDERQAC